MVAFIFKAAVKKYKVSWKLKFSLFFFLGLKALVLSARVFLLFFFFSFLKVPFLKFLTHVCVCVYYSERRESE